MAIEDREFMRLEFRVEAAEAKVTKLEAEIKEMFGLLKEMSGANKVNVQFDLIGNQLAELLRDNGAQASEIGELRGTIKAMAVALTKSSDTRLVSAAQAITINVEGGKGGSGGTAAGAVTNNGGNNTLTGDVQ